MSHYTSIQTMIKDEDCLLETLCELFKVTPGQLKVTKTAEHLYDYTGKKRPQVAHIVIDKEIVNKAAGGGAANDMGFLKKPDGTWEAIIDDHSRNSLRYNDKWMSKLKQEYAIKVSVKGLKKKNPTVKRETLANGTVKLSIIAR